MKTKKSKRVMAVVMAVLLTVGIMPMDWAVTKAAASTVHSFDATAQASVGDDKAVIAEGTTFNDGYCRAVYNGKRFFRSSRFKQYGRFE